MAETDAENLLLHLIELPTNRAELDDPISVREGVVRATADDETIVAVEIVVFGEIAVDDSEEVPLLAFFAESGDEDVEVSAVSFLHELRVARCEKQSEPLRLMLLLHHHWFDSRGRRGQLYNREEEDDRSLAHALK